MKRRVRKQRREEIRVLPRPPRRFLFLFSFFFSSPKHLSNLRCRGSSRSSSSSSTRVLTQVIDAVRVDYRSLRQRRRRRRRRGGRGCRLSRCPCRRLCCRSAAEGEQLRRLPNLDAALAAVFPDCLPLDHLGGRCRSNKHRARGHGPVGRRRRRRGRGGVGRGR